MKKAKKTVAKGDQKSQRLAPGAFTHAKTRSPQELSHDSGSKGTALQTMSQWVVAIADNIRNPVAGMGAALDVMRHQLEIRDDPQRSRSFDPSILNHAMTMIGERLSSLNEYVTELVDFAKVPLIYPQKTFIPSLVRELVQDTIRHFPFQVEFTVEIDPKVGELWVDPYRLKNSLRALLINGVEAASPLMHDLGTPSLHIHIAVQTDQGKPAVVGFFVEDNGPGLSKEARIRCLEAFFSTKEAGTGLGLFLVQKYMMAHGGRMVIEDPLILGGARIGFLLPLNHAGT
jgi:signal transduction histidine kinase